MVSPRVLFDDDSDVTAGNASSGPTISRDGTERDRVADAAEVETEFGGDGRIRRPRMRPARVSQQDPDYQVIQNYIADFARELNDRASLRVSTVRAYNLYRRSGLPRDAFLEQLYATRAIVKERTPAITSTGEPGPLGTPVKHRVAYYFAVLEDLLGLRTGADGQADT